MTYATIGYTLWDPGFELNDPGPMLDEAEELGVDTVEIPLFQTRLLGNGRIIEPAMRRFECETRIRDLDYSAHAMLSINLMDDGEVLDRHVEMACRNIEIAARLGANHLVVHCGLTDEVDPVAINDAFARQRDCLAVLGDHADAHGVRICVETIWNFDGRTTALPGRLARELGAVSHPAVWATLDFAHAALQCDLLGADLRSEIRQIAPWSCHLHLNDCFGKATGIKAATPAEEAAYGVGDLHLPIGWGSLPWESLIDDFDYPSRIALNQELHPTYWHALADDVAEMRRLAGYLLPARRVPAMMVG